MADVPTRFPKTTIGPLDQARLRHTLEIALTHTSPTLSTTDYCLVGTAAAVLHGVPLPAGDVDLVMQQRAGVDAFSSALTAFPCVSPPTFIPEGKQYYTAYDIHGVQVEASTVEWESDSPYIETFGRGPWEHHVLIDVGPYRVPTIQLELRLVTELLRNRPDRSTPLTTWMQTHGCDIDLLRRVMAARSVPRHQQEHVLAQLRSTA